MAAILAAGGDEAAICAYLTWPVAGPVVSLEEASDSGEASMEASSSDEADAECVAASLRRAEMHAMAGTAHADVLYADAW